MVCYRLHNKLWDDHVRGIMAGPFFLHTKKMGLPYQKLSNTILNYVKMEPIRKECILTCHNKLPSFQLHPVFADMCSHCGGRDLRVQLQEGISICAECGLQHGYVNDLASSLAPRSRKRDTPRRLNQVSVKRINHFTYWLRRLQGDESYTVPVEVVNQVKDVLANYRHLHEPSYWNIKSALRILKKQQYYNHAIQIMSRIRGCPLVKLKRENEIILVNMFIQVHDVITTHLQSRINMLYYPYLIRKLCEIQGWWQMARSIPMLKSKLKTYYQDKIWETVCREVGWPFYVTV